MKIITLASTSIALAALAACGGSNNEGEDPVRGVDFEISNGVIANFEVPTDEQIAELPSQIADTVNAFIDANENTILTSTLPTGEALFVGPWAMGENDDGDSLVGGTMSIDVDFDPGDEFLNGRLDVEYVFDDDGNLLPVTPNYLEGQEGKDVAINGVIEDGAISGTMNGRFDVDGETTTIGGFVNGSFTGDGATGAIGTLEASVQNGADSGAGFEGLFKLDRTVRD